MELIGDDDKLDVGDEEEGLVKGEFLVCLEHLGG